MFWPCWREWTWSSSRLGRSLKSAGSRSGRRGWWSTAWRTAETGCRRTNAAASCLLQRWRAHGCCRKRQTQGQEVRDRHTQVYSQSETQTQLDLCSGGEDILSPKRGALVLEALNCMRGFVHAARFTCRFNSPKGKSLRSLLTWLIEILRSHAWRCELKWNWLGIRLNAPMEVL